MSVKRSFRIGLGSVDLQIEVPGHVADRIKDSAAFRVMSPGVHMLARRLAGRQPGAADTSNAVGRRVPQLLPRPVDVPLEARAIIDRVAARSWYHTIDLGFGVATPGFVDHRPQMGFYGIPESLEGMRCLDVATFDGFWAFEMERREAGEVVALDLARFSDSDIPKVIVEDAIRLDGEQPTGAGFRLAADILGSSVKRETCNVYDLSPERFGKFDLVFLSDLLIHLRDPQLALERVFSVCRGNVIVADSYDPAVEAMAEMPMARFTGGIASETWWLPNVATLRAMMEVAGFEPVTEFSRFVLDAASVGDIHKVVLHGRVPESHSWRRLVEDEAVRREKLASDTAGEELVVRKDG